MFKPLIRHTYLPFAFAARYSAEICFSAHYPASKLGLSLGARLDGFVSRKGAGTHSPTSSVTAGEPPEARSQAQRYDLTAEIRGQFLTAGRESLLLL